MKISNELPQTNTPAAPGYFSAKTKALWKAVLTEYDLAPEMLELFRLALENLDLADAARQLLRAEGLVVGGKKHPAADLVKMHDGLYLRAMRQLGLDVVQSQKDAGRRIK